MTTKDFLLPDLGEGLTEGEVVSWLVAVGDVVEVDQYVAEIETAKAVVEVPSPFAGTVQTLHAQPGEEVAVGAPLITIDVGGSDSDQSADAESADAESADAESADAETADDAPPAEDAGESGNVLVGYGTSTAGGSRRARVSSGGSTGDSAGGATATPAGDGTPQPVVREGRPLAKPPVRKMAKDLGVDLDYVAGSGADGIITRADVQAAADRVDETADATVPASEDYAKRLAPAGEQPLVADELITIPAAPEDLPAQQRVPMNQMRRTIAAQMSRSRREIPEAVTWVEADATPLWDFRKKLNNSLAGTADEGVKVSALAIIMRMAVAGLKKYPTLNASLDTAAGEMVLHRHINLGFAAQTDRGLVVPVIKGAHDMNIVQLAAALNDLATTARSGKLSPADMSGGTFTVSNYGAFGVDGGDMVINHPEAAILGTGRITDKPWVVGGKVKVRKIITYSIAFDHRLIDGGDGAGFVRHLADLTENPTLLTAAL
ncbi:MAG: dihydrolipoamide acetyltransferase family protein [Euzebya sp.]